MRRSDDFSRTDHSLTLMFEFSINHLVTALFCIGLGQLVWLSITLLRRSVQPTVIWRVIPPLLSIWVVMWPLYDDPIWVWAGIFVLGTPLVLCYSADTLLLRQLRIAWSGMEQPGALPHMWPLVSLIAALSIAAALFYRSPEFGLGIALSVCLAFPAAKLLDYTQQFRLGLALHPQQTLAGHLGLIVFVALFCGWSLHVYHGIVWSQVLVASTIAGIAASLVRALFPIGWNLPLAALAMGTTLWLL